MKPNIKQALYDVVDAYTHDRFIKELDAKPMMTAEEFLKYLKTVK